MASLGDRPQLIGGFRLENRSRDPGRIRLSLGAARKIEVSAGIESSSRAVFSCPVSELSKSFAAAISTIL